MGVGAESVSLLVAEDDDDDFMLLARALERTGWTRGVRRFRDGEELMEALLAPEDPEKPGDRRPVIILLDLNMPRKNGHETLRDIRAHPRLKAIPVVVLTSSAAEDDVSGAYAEGANSYVRKPAGFERLCEFTQAFRRFWTEVADLPSGGADGR